ncbi:Ser/Thr protein kinase [Acanthamoeba castellanii medusavirus]|uniref:non-specific serine/threonine protein kinase n=1 Tax=Acanthamoeba castellanii medusavirus J1 TaxID=3114988 RepID=A0A3T1CWF2_9VIRU|nr:Ser/Thr protein kinase [Acanthamoeba castellanii medusavirus]BBI30152.1 Ser/Thr protein kinase [Acanthamoeba castellanii medusavirus J1]
MSTPTLALVLTLIFAALWSPSLAQPTQVTGSGPQSAGPMFSAWLRAYEAVNPYTNIRYEAVGNQQATLNSPTDDYSVFERFVPHRFEIQYNISQLPFVGLAMVMAYNVPEISSEPQSLVIDGSTLALIMRGEISRWNDPRIVVLNPWATALPDADIQLGLLDDFYLSSCEVLKLACSSFDPVFAAELNATILPEERPYTFTIGFFSRMAPAIEGRMDLVGDSSAARLEWLRGRPYGLTFLDYADVRADNGSTVRYMPMYNRAGALVQPSVDSVRSAMRDFKDQFAAGNLTVDIFDAPGNGSWPLSYMIFFSSSNYFVQDDCSRTARTLELLFWAVTNKLAATVATELQMAPLDPNIKKRMLDRLETIKCNGKQSYRNKFVVGYGAQVSMFSEWVPKWNSLETTIDYYETASREAVDLQINYSGDFGVTINGAESVYSTQSMPDLASVPLVAFAIVPAYNVPALNIPVYNEDGVLVEFERLPLVLDYECIAGIYLGEITMWNDTRILSLNAPRVREALTNASTPIVLVVDNTDSDSNEIITSFLSDKSPHIDRSRRPVFPVPTAINTSSDFAVAQTLVVTPGSFAVCFKYHIFGTSRNGEVQTAIIARQDGTTISATTETLRAAVDEHYHGASSLGANNPLILASGHRSWPAVGIVAMAYRSRTMEDHARASTVADFIYWTQTDPVVRQDAIDKGYVIAIDNVNMSRIILDRLATFVSSEGLSASSIAGCIHSGTVCSNAGTCNANRCICGEDRSGYYCEILKSSGSSSSTLVTVLAIVIPLCLVVGIVSICAIVVFAFIAARKHRESREWEIDYDELEIFNELGSGGFGTVHRAMWKSTEVAVKTVNEERVTRDIMRCFQEEARVMSALRHPNIVTFMAACTKLPRLAIVMEYMPLGSLFDLLHNELVPELPLSLMAKMALQAARGMHYLHSSGIVHRDLKSLNILLDKNWNTKISDFGLTKFKEDIVQNDRAVGSVHWTAPEILSETPNPSYELADVYSFGVVLWETLTREQPYFGLSSAAIAVAVIRDGMRPPLPPIDSTTDILQAGYIGIISECWHQDPTVRPTFLELIPRLTPLVGGGSSTGFGDNSSTTATSSTHDGEMVRRNRDDSWTLPSGASVATSSCASSGKGKGKPAQHPTGVVTVVFTDITRASSLWNFDAEAMRDATMLHNRIIRSEIERYGGYEALIPHGKTTGEGTFCVVFQDAVDAIEWCRDVQRALLVADWPAKLLEHPGACEMTATVSEDVVFRGPRVRMGVHTGIVRDVRHPISRRVEYTGSTISNAIYITSITHGGQILVSDIVSEIIANRPCAGVTSRLLPGGKFSLIKGEPSIHLSELVISGLHGRFFGGVSTDGDSDGEDNGDGSTGSHSSSFRDYIEHGFEHKEDTFLTSANLCRWVIDPLDISMGEQLGVGSYGIVHKGKWKGVDVAVKRFINQRLNERALLDFRTEIAFLSGLHHPNIVLFIGACLDPPNLAIVVEYMPQDLKRLLADTTAKLGWSAKSRLIRTAAIGINYLHSLQPIIVHRDLKPSNMLVDEQNNVKIADFGFARIKEENTTMTRCGTPCWTAPEIIRGEKYDESADVYSFGIIMWQVITRKEPYAGRNFMGVSLDVLEGKRPAIPGDCPPHLRKLLKKCWHDDPTKRPTMEQVLEMFDGRPTDIEA